MACLRCLDKMTVFDNVFFSNADDGCIHQTNAYYLFNVGIIKVFNNCFFADFRLKLLAKFGNGKSKLA